MKLKNKQSFASRRSFSGFTLIELLVVIAIIGLLSTVVLVSLQNVRADARDAKRMATIKQISTALENYYNDNVKYPPSTANGIIDGTWTAATDIDSILSNYMTGKPKDPLHDGTNYYFRYDSNANCGDLVGIKARICIFNLETSKYINTAACPNSSCDYNFVFGESSS